MDIHNNTASSHSQRVYVKIGISNPLSGMKPCPQALPCTVSAHDRAWDESNVPKLLLMVLS